MVLSRIPLLRILLPFMAGILFHRAWHLWWVPIMFIALAIALYALLTVLSRSPQGRLRFRAYFIVPLAMAALALGWIASNIHCPPRLAIEQRDGRVLTGRIARLQYTDFSMRMAIDVLSPDLPPCRVMVSTRGCDYILHAGDLVAWQGHLAEVSSLGNPDEMDYARYLLDSEGIRYQQHLPLKQVKRIGHSPTLRSRLENLRRDLKLKVFNSRLTPMSQQFVVALLLGDSGVIDKATRQDFSTAGVAHVLALSGLHVGFIALIIWWLLFPLDYLRLKKLRLVITLVAITAFALFTGLSPSVMRATVMIGMVLMSLFFYKRSLSLNALAMAALAILVFSPSALFSVGFQLSFITVGAVLMFARLPEELAQRPKWIQAVISTVITSLVAMLATIALTAHYFHTISLMSVLSNLLILPVLPVFMVLGAIFLLVTAAGMQWALLDWVLDGIYHYIHGATSVVNAIPLSHIGNVYVSTFGVVAYFAIMALVVLWLYRRNYRFLLAAGVALLILLAHSLWVDARTPRQGLVVFNSYSSTPIFYYNGGTGYVWAPDGDEPDSASFARYYSGFLSRHGIGELHFITNEDSLQLDNGFIRPPYAHLMGHRLMAVGAGRWKRMTVTHQLALDEVIVTKHYHGTAAKLQELFHFNRLIISGAYYESARLQHECDSLGLEYTVGYCPIR